MNKLKLNTAFFAFFLLSFLGFSQCNTTNFTVSRINGTCFSNASITVTVATSTNCSAWVAEIIRTVPGSSPVALSIPTNGGSVTFTSLSAGNYNVSLSNGFTTIQHSGNPVLLSSSYVNMNVSSSSTPPICTNSSTGYQPNGTLTASVTGGTGPFLYRLISSVSNQAHTSPLRTFTFNNVPGGEQVSLQVTDFVNGGVGCENTITQTPVTVAQTAADLTFGLRAYNYVRECSNCSTARLFINLTNLTAARRDFLLQPGNAKITIGGIDYPLTFVAAQNRFTYDPILSGGPNLTNGLQVTTTFNWGCRILTRTNTVDIDNNFLNVFSTVTMNPDCSFRYRITVIGDRDNVNTGFIDRNLFFCAENSVVIERRVSTNPDVWQVLVGPSVNPDPANSVNDLNVSGALTSNLPSAGMGYFVDQAGVYRVTASDACHTVSRTITISDIIAINSLNASGSPSMLSGTVGINVPTTSYTGQFPVTIKVERVDGQTSMPIVATNPLSRAGNYTVNFPITRTFNSNPGGISIIDLPPGQYRVELSDGCTEITGNKKIQVLNLTNVAVYNPQFSVVNGCSNSNRINFNLNVNSNVLQPSTSLFNSNGTLVQTLAASSGSFINLLSGNYNLLFSGVGNSGSVFSGALNSFGPFSYNRSISINQFQNFSITTSSVLCDLNDPNSGIVSAQAVNGTINYPLTFSLFNASNPTTPIQGPYTVNSPETSYVFTNIPIGSYFVRISSICYSADKNLTVSTVATIPTAQVDNPTICPGSPTTVAIISATNNLFDVTWTDENNNIVGTGIPITLAPTTTTTYTATFAIKQIFGCLNTITYQSSVTVKVTPNANLSLAVSDINLCDGSAPSVTISNTQSEFTYEIVNSNGNSLSPPLLVNGTGGSITIPIPNTITLVAGQTLNVKATNGNAGCTGIMTDVVQILNGTFTITCPTFPSSSVQCYADLPTQNRFTVSQFQALGNGDGRIDVIGCGSIEITATNGVNSGCNSNVTRTYTITEYADPNNNDIRDVGENTILNSSTCTQSININDTTSPVVIGTLPTLAINGCSVSSVPIAMSTVLALEESGLLISDNCTSDANLVVTSLDGISFGTCPITLIRSYTITDICGNTSTKTQTITVNDTSSPIASGTLAPIAVNGCSIFDAPTAMTTVSQLETAGLIISDTCTTNSNVVVSYNDGIPSGTCPITFIRTYILTDICGNSTTKSQNITINDNSSPVISGSLTILTVAACSIENAPPAMSTVAQLETAGLTISDACTSNVNLLVSHSDGTPSGICPTIFVRTYSIADACGNIATVDQVIHINDIISPLILGTLPNLSVQGCTFAAAPTAMTTVSQLESAGLTISDACTSDINLLVTYNDGLPSGTCPVTFERIYSIIDACGNTTLVNQTITIEDTLAPVIIGTMLPITVIGCDVSSAPSAMTTVSQLELAGLTISDVCSSDTNLVVTYIDGVVSGICPISFTRTYVISDVCGNSAYQTQVIIINDTIAPTVTGVLPILVLDGCSITAAPSAMTTVSQLETAGLAISDACTSDINLVVTHNDNITSLSCPISVSRTYIITDACGNVTTKTQIINIIDTIAPVVSSAVGSLNITLECSNALAISNATLAVPLATDNCTSLLVRNLISDTTLVSATCPNSYIRTRIWNFTDSCGNTSVNFQQIITVQDTTAPIFSLPLPTDLTLECSQPIPSAVTLTAADNCNGLVTINFTEQINNTDLCPNNYFIIRTWVATDICGNSQTHTQQITIQDTTPPVFVGELPILEVFAKCDSIPEAPILKAIDNCGEAIINFSEVRIDGDCKSKFRLERTWTATDLCGNETQTTQTVYLACYVTPYNALSPDGDGLNDIFIIEGLECYPNNTVEIFNRWGVLVYEATFYDNVNNVFRGFSDGRSTISRNDKLPTGDYWYTLKYEYDLYGKFKENIEKIGYIYIQN